MKLSFSVSARLFGIWSICFLALPLSTSFLTENERANHGWDIFYHRNKIRSISSLAIHYDRKTKIELFAPLFSPGIFFTVSSWSWVMRSWIASKEEKNPSLSQGKWTRRKRASRLLVSWGESSLFPRVCPYFLEHQIVGFRAGKVIPGLSEGERVGGKKEKKDPGKNRRRKRLIFPSCPISKSVPNNSSLSLFPSLVPSFLVDMFSRRGRRGTFWGRITSMSSFIRPLGGALLLSRYV